MFAQKLYFDYLLGLEVCHPPYGCFSDEEPFHRTMVKLPRPPSEINTKFLLHTRSTWGSEEKIPHLLDPLIPDMLRKSAFDGVKKTAIFVHGYLGM